MNHRMNTNDGPPRASGRRPVRRHRAKGTVLIVSMWVLLVLAGLVVVVAGAMRVEADRSANDVAARQAAAVELGAIQYVMANVDGLQGRTPAEADTLCEAVSVGDGAFWILRPSADDDRTYCYGITDEASKVNLNTATPDMLAKLPSMTDELSAAIVDWRDADSTVTAGGAESEYYLMLADPYECKNAPLETVEELFLLRGATKEVLFGADANRNGILDPGENTSTFSGTFAGTGRRLDRGLHPYVTVYSTEASGTSSGAATSTSTATGGTSSSTAATSTTTTLVNVNEAQGQVLIELFRTVVAADRLPVVIDRIRRGRPFQSDLDFYLRVGLTASEFGQVADKITTSAQGKAGLINVNTAPQEVLLCLPGLEESDASALVAKRSATDPPAADVAWVAEVLPRAKAAAIGGSITVRTFRFSADIVSVAASGRAFKRCRVVIDARTSPPKVLYRQDLTCLGWPLSRDILTGLRSGVPLERAIQTVGAGGVRP